MRRTNRTLLGVLSSIVLLAAPAQAQTVSLRGPEDLSGAETVVTFDGLGLSNANVVEEVDGVAFELEKAGRMLPARFLADDSAAREFDPQGRGALYNTFADWFPYSDLRIGLPDVMHRVAFMARVSIWDDLRVVLRRDGDVVDEVVVPSRGYNQYYFYGFENDAGFDEVLVDVVADVSGVLRFDNLMFEAFEDEPEPPLPVTLACDGFRSPWDRFLSSTSASRNAFWRRVFARRPDHVLLARLRDADGVSLGADSLAAPPVVRVELQGASGGEPVDVTETVLGSAPDAFRYGVNRDTWRFFLPRRSMPGPGTYDVTIESGDAAEYVIDPTCTRSITVDEEPDLSHLR